MNVKDEKQETWFDVQVGRQDISCPFCNEGDFDLIGLKWHIEANLCDTFLGIVVHL